MKRRLFVILLLLIIIFIGFISFSKRNFSFISPLTTSSITSLIPSPWKPKPITLETIFSLDHSIISKIPDDKKWILIATGDIIPARSVNYQTVKRNDFTWSWINIIPVLSEGDITLINLESPLVPSCTVTIEGMVFCGDQRHIQGLKAGHVTVANFANNHMGNYGLKGIEETKQLLETNSINVSGLGKPTMIEVKGIRISFLGFDDIGPNVAPIADTNEESIKQQILEAKKQADIVIVSMNWGIEYTDRPSDRQTQLAHFVIDSGADLIIGNHPHWIEPVEIYKEKVIMYAHGNTIFDQMWSEKTKIGVIGKYTFYGKDLVDIEFIPTYIKDYGQPVLLEGDQKKQVVDQLNTISRTAIP